MLFTRELLKGGNSNLENVIVSYSSFKTASLSWKFNSALHYEYDGLMVQLQDLTGKNHDQWAMNLSPETTSINIPFELIPGHSYLAYVCGMRMLDLDNTVAYVVEKEARTEFRAEFTRQKLSDLFYRCQDYIYRKPHQLRPCQYLYRNKPMEYWNSIFENNNGIMDVYAKDLNGDPASVINNGLLRGLFFGASVEISTGLPPQKSHFGPRRFLIPTEYLITPISNLYFADFYCNFQAHYITIVLTKSGSEPDKFCREKLMELNKFDNDYIKLSMSSTGKLFFLVNCNIWLEILYTEDIDLNIAQYEWEAKWQNTESTGTSRRFGIPKNSQCKLCNLYS